MVASHTRGIRALRLGCALAILCAVPVLAHAVVTGRVQGRVIGADTSEPIGGADVVLLPADTTMRRVGALTNADGTYLLEAAPGRYTLQVRALSFARKRIEGIVVMAGVVVPVPVALTSEAIQQKEVVVEARALTNTESAMLVMRRRAATVNDAVSAEQIRRAPDKDAAEVLRRVTGLSVTDGKYVFVRGLGERYSSTEVDGVRVATPEQNKRVVPLDLFPAALLENIVVQKAYTPDRPGEFGGGDVQVHTKDFPGGRSWSVSMSQGETQGATFHHRLTYAGDYHDGIGFGAGGRAIPQAIPAGPLPPDNSAANHAALVAMARSFGSVWSPYAVRALPNAAYTATYGDEVQVLGHPLGLIESWNFSRSFDTRRESQRLFRSASADTLYDYDVRRDTESARLGGLSALSYRITPNHVVHLRGLYSHSADNEVRQYEGLDHSRTEAVSQTWLAHRNTRLTYVERELMSGALEGQHHVPKLSQLELTWRVTRSRARRQQPDRREVVYDRRYYFEGDTAHWLIGSQGNREFGDLHDDGNGGTVTAAVPWRVRPLGAGKLTVGWDRQTKRRDNFYRRFQLIHSGDPNRWELPPDSLFGPGSFEGPTAGYLTENTFNDARYTDNYRAHQRVNAGFVSADVPFGPRVRGNLGARVERGFQDVRSVSLFAPDVVLQEGRLDNTDWLPSANLTWAATPAINVRMAASRTLSRPDLNELSPSPSQEYENGLIVLGNPTLRRARIENYDLRVEAFPSLSEVFAAGVFYKRLYHPIEEVIIGSADPVLKPINTEGGHNTGVELEMRAHLGRLWRPLASLSVNTNASFIASEVRQAVSTNGSQRHPLQGQADHLVNAALSWSAPDGRAEATVLVNATGRRLKALGFLPLPDVYERPFTSLDATVACVAVRHLRAKLSARNLLDPRIRQMQGEAEVSGFHIGRSYALALSYGS